jgi:tRNA pseudouridine55 synthase
MSDLTATLWNECPVYTAHNWPPTTEALPLGGIVLVNKPIGVSSFFIVKKVRHFLNIKKVGHAGTLDPAADGLLIVCFGKATKLVAAIQELDKTYDATVMLGKETASYDRETPVTQELSYEHVTDDHIDATLQDHFVGNIEQIPPIYSALKSEGEALYKKARRGEHVDIPARNVTVYSIHRLISNLPLVKLEINCGKGTYIRSIAHDLGRKLNTCAYLAALTRTTTGSFSLENAIQLDDLRRTDK